MGKKRFIDKKKAATFQLVARDSSDPNFSTDAPSGDRIFVRVDNNHYSLDTFLDAADDGKSVFADAPDDYDDNEDAAAGVSENRVREGGAGALPEHIRREILELGFPDDGYNYLIHMREIKNSGGGSVYYHNSKAKLDELPRDVKAYDASRLEIARANDDSIEKSIYSVGLRTVGVRIQKAVDAEVAALLDDSDLSRFGSDNEDLDEDFVVKANLPVEVDDVEFNNKLNLDEGSGVNSADTSQSIASCSQENATKLLGEIETRKDQLVANNEKLKVRRLLDEQFDMLEHQEYGTDSEEEYNFIADEDEHQESLAEKLSHTLKNHKKEDLVLKDDEYRAPAELLRDNEMSQNTEPAVILQRCREYAENYDNSEEEEDLVFEEESSDQSEVWDCETIISTYSNLDNHPGKIGAPGARRKKKLAEKVSETLSAPNNIICLRGKEKLPVDHLPHGRKCTVGKEKEVDSSRKEQQKRKQHGQESKEEKRERKAAVKEERREARKAKKEMKGIYGCESQRAQRVAAYTGPSSIHLM